MIGLAAEAPSNTGDHLDARPLVASRRAPASPWLFVAFVLFLGTILFLVLNNARQERNKVEPKQADADAVPETVPALILPPNYDGQSQAAVPGRWATPYSVSPYDAPQARPSPVVRRPAVQVRVAPVSSRASVAPAPYYSQPEAAYSVPAPQPSLSQPQVGLQALGQPNAVAPATRTIPATKAINPAMTIMQGSIVAAVLESALDSTAPGQVRALVTRDAYSADGSRVLIPRGSRLYGTYASSVTEGQKRLQVRWTRLVRPDMVSIALDSPASDPLGRAGLPGSVNSHFLTRFANSLLSSTVALGGLLASRSSSPVVVAMPTGGASQVLQPSRGPGGEIRPTLTVRQGSRVSVFVQHDLDFSAVETAS